MRADFFYPFSPVTFIAMPLGSLFRHCDTPARYGERIQSLTQAHFNAAAHEIELNSLRVEELRSCLADAVAAFPHMGATTGSTLLDPSNFRKASVFKHAGFYFAAFVEHAPIVEAPFPASTDPYLLTFPNIANTMFAFSMVRQYLLGQLMARPTPLPPVELKNALNPSQHSYMDYLHAGGTFDDISQYPRDQRSTVRVNRYKLCALVFEQMAYLDNPDASYPRVSLPR